MNLPEKHQIKKAIISVSDKNGIVEFARELNILGIEIYSTGGTKAALSAAGIPVKSVGELTNFPEILGGRVKTLHPGVHAALLADLGEEEHINQLREHNIASVDMLVVNLYPFEQTLKNKNATHQELIENIDIGGPAMIRASAKNYRWTAVVVNPEFYDRVLQSLRSKECTIDLELRAALAGEAFSHTAYYDSLISSYFANHNKIEFPQNLTLAYKTDQHLRYGENPHQKAMLYGNFTSIFKQIHGKELSYNNIIDIDAASKLILEFEEDADAAVAIIKHTNPCGVGIGANLSEAYNRAFTTDTVSPFGGIIAMNRICDLEMAETIHSIYTEVLIAPAFSEEALELLSKKRDRRLIQINFDELADAINFDLKSVAGGLLMQRSDTKLIDAANMEVVTKRQPTKDELKAMMFAWKVCKHVKSNAIVYTNSQKTLGIGAGQMSRVDSSRIAVEKSQLMELELKGSVVASDAFFPFADGLIEAAKAGATAIIQPGGSVRDEEVIKVADEYDLAMIFTGARHFRH